MTGTSYQENRIVKSMIHRKLIQLAIVAIGLIVAIPDTANGQFGFFGRRGRGAVVVGPILPTPYYRSPWVGEPIVAVPSSGIRVRTPFFSLNIDGRGAIPARPYAYNPLPGTYPPIPSRPIYPDYLSDRYGRYGGAYGDRYPHPDDLGYDGRRESHWTDRYRSFAPELPREPLTIPMPGSVLPDTGSAGVYGQYRGGPDGGLPALTDMSTFSLQDMRQAAETLRAAINRRPDDAEAWLDYLQPDTIIADVVAGTPSASMWELLDRYDGVTRNPELSAVTRLDGFLRTRQLLALWLQRESALETPYADVTPNTATSPLNPMPAIEPENESQSDSSAFDQLPDNPDISLEPREPDATEPTSSQRQEPELLPAPKNITPELEI